MTKELIKKEMLELDERTKRLRVIISPDSTNYFVENLQARAIESIIDETYEVVPLKTYNSSLEKKQYWLYSPGEGSRLWEEFYKNGIMAIGWDDLDDLSKYENKIKIKEKIQEIYGENHSYKNSVHATWQFTNEINIGDLIYVKKGVKKILGRGIVSSSYRFDESRDEYANTREVIWTDKGEWELDEKNDLKTLTKINYREKYCKMPEDMFYTYENEDFQE